MGPPKTSRFNLAGQIFLKAASTIVTKITATVKTPNGDIDATSYESSGTSYSQFAVINHGDGNNFQVTRRVS